MMPSNARYVGCGAQWLERATDMTIAKSRVRIPLAPHGNFWQFGNFVYATLPVIFGRDTESQWSLLSGANTRGGKISHTSGKCLS